MVEPTSPTASAVTRDTDDIATIRRFNRTVTERIGALEDTYLERGRSLGASRLLWEIDPDGSDLRSLRSRLSLDSGYLSRLLRSLEREGLVSVEADIDDKRARTVRVTNAGRAERAELDRRSDELAGSLLARLDRAQRAELVAAAAKVERLLTAGLVEVAIEDPTTDRARFCLRSYFEELDTRFETGFDPESSNPADDEELREPAGLLLVASLRQRPVGCGALKLHGSEPAEIKRMWVSPAARGLGLGRRLLSELEHCAAERGAGAARLETNRSLSEAIGLYRSAGYEEVDAFNRETYAHHWFEKQLRF